MTELTNRLAASFALQVIAIELHDRPGSVNSVAEVFSGRGLQIEALHGSAEHLNPDGHAHALISFYASPERASLVTRVLRRLYSVRHAELLAADDAAAVFLHRARDRADRVHRDPRHVRERDDPAFRVVGRGDARRETRAHPPHRVGGKHHVAADVVQHPREHFRAGPQDRDDLRHDEQQTMRGFLCDGAAAGQRREQLVAQAVGIEARAGAGGEQHAGG